MQCPDDSVFLHLELTGETKDGCCPVEIQDTPVAHAASAVAFSLGVRAVESMETEFISAANGAALDSCEPAAFNGCGSKCRVVQEEQRSLMEDISDEELEQMKQQHNASKEDDDDAGTVHSQAAVDAARALAFALLEQANHAELKKAASPPASSLQAAAKIGPEEPDNDLFNMIRLIDV